MNRFIFFLFFMSIPSSFCMDAPARLIACAQETPGAISESGHTSVHKGCILELVLQADQEALKKYIFTGRGEGVAKMYAIAADVRSLRLVSRTIKEWIDSDTQLNDLIEMLARQYTYNNRVEVAVALGTKPAFEWLSKKKISLMDDLTKEVINQLMRRQIGVARALITVSKDEKFGPQFVQTGLNHSVIGVDGNTLLNAAAMAADDKIFSEALSFSYQTLDTPNNQGSTPLLHAIDFGFTDRALKLLDLKVKRLFYSDDNLIDSALLHAVQRNNVPVIERLLEYEDVRRNINYVNSNKPAPPLTVAARNNNYEAFKLLLAVPSIRIKGGAIYWAIAQNQNMLADLLAIKDLDFNQECYYGEPRVMGYPSFGLVAQTQDGQPLLDDKATRDRLSLIAPRIDLNAQIEESRKTLLMIAIEQGKAKTIEKLLELGANVRVADVEGKTALDYAQKLTTHNKDRILKMLQAAHNQKEEAKS